MTDYLGRLAARTLAPRTAVQPRTPAAFEGDALQTRAEEVAVAPRSSSEQTHRAEPERITSETHEVREQPSAPVAAPATAMHVQPQRIVEHRTDVIPDIRKEVITLPAGESEPVEIHHEVLREREIPRVLERVRLRRERITRETETTVAAHSAAPPPIEITIGRIDVRPVIAPAAQQPREPKRPAIMTLEEYVARRDGGGR